MSTDITKKIADHFAQYPTRSYPKGQIMIHAGDEPQRIFYLESGKVRQYDISYRGDEIIVNVFKEHAFFPMLWAVAGIPNKYFFEAETDVTVRVAPRDETLDYLRSNPDVLFDLLTRIYIGVDGLLGRMVRLMSGSARSRMLYELVVECRRFGTKAKDGSIEVNINESDLAARAGLSRETVSREIQKVSRDGLIKVSHGSIKVKSLEALENKLAAEI